MGEIQQRRAPSALAVAAMWLRLIVGLGLATVGGVAFGYALGREREGAWWWGGLALALGVVLVLTALPKRRRIVLPPSEMEPEEETGGRADRDALVPLVGALLVYKYQLITHAQLMKALEKQQKTTPRRKLGELLVREGLITADQLHKALEHQQELMQEKEASGRRG